MADAALLAKVFARFGLPLSAAEAALAPDYDAKAAILMLLANREVAARFESAHGRSPEEADLEALLDLYEALAGPPEGPPATGDRRQHLR